jgi:uncharacterized protein DUF1990
VVEVATTVSYSFAFEPPLDTWARWFTVVPTRSYVRVDDQGFEAVYGPWRVATVWSNVIGVERTGPYRAWKVAGPAHLSLADRGMTMAGTTVGGACLRFREPVRGIDPLGLLRHPALTLGVADLDAFLELVEQRIAAAGPVDGASRPPDHREGRVGGAVRAVWRWKRRDVAHDQRRVERVDLPAVDRAGGLDDQPVEIGVGPTFHRKYRTVVRGATLDAEQAMAVIQSDLNVLADEELAPFTKVRGESPGMRVGDRYVVEVTGPWKGAVEVVHVSPRAFRLTTLEGHMESGAIEMAASDVAGGNEVTFSIESWSRSHDRFLDLLYDKVGIAKALQAEMWSVACERFVKLVGGEPIRPMDITTERAG